MLNKLVVALLLTNFAFADGGEEAANANKAAPTPVAEGHNKDTKKKEEPKKPAPKKEEPKK